MVLIISIEDDPSTEDVIFWIKSLGADYLRINPSTTIEIETISLDGDNSKIVLKVGTSLINLDDISSYWYRSGELTLYPFNLKVNSEHEYFITHYLQKEVRVIEEFIYRWLSTKFHINEKKDNETNKLTNLLIASECGLSIPPTMIKYGVERDRNYITKALFNGSFGIANKFRVGAGTHKANQSFISNFPSLYQTEIKKKYELRVFYLHGEFYSVAIFSQANKKTALDFRNYDKKKPNRVVPYKLPDVVEFNLNLFMQKIQMNCGSIDLIVTSENEYIFLEVNPVGQFQQVSIPGNYYLEKIIATKLTKSNG